MFHGTLPDITCIRIGQNFQPIGRPVQSSSLCWSGLCRVVLDCSVLFWNVPCCSGLFRLLLDRSVFFWIVQCCSGLFRVLLDSSVFFWIVTFCSELFRVVLDCSVFQVLLNNVDHASLPYPASFFNEVQFNSVMIGRDNL